MVKNYVEVEKDKKNIVKLYTHFQEEKVIVKDVSVVSSNKKNEVEAFIEVENLDNVN